MKQLKKIKGLLVMAVVLLFVAALPAQASGLKKQAPVKLTIQGLKGTTASCGTWLTFKASGGTTGSYVLVLEVDGNPARFVMDARGEKSLRVGAMNNDGTVLPIGVNYEVYVIRAGGHYCDKKNGCSEYDTESSAKQSFRVTYDPTDSYKLVAKGAIRYYDKYHEQWSLETAPILYRRTADGGWQEYLDPEQLGAVYRYEIRDASGKLVSMDGMIKDPGSYTVDVVELFEDPFTGKVVQVKADTVKAAMSPISVDPGMLDGGKGTVGPSVKVDPDKLGGGTGTQGSGTQGGIMLMSGNTKINATAAAVKAGREKITSLKAKKGGKAVLKFKKTSGAKGYQIVYGTNKKLTKGKKTKTTKGTSVTLKNLKKNKTYYFKVRAYTVDASGKKVYGKYSAVKSVKIKK